MKRYRWTSEGMQEADAWGDDAWGDWVQYVHADEAVEMQQRIAELKNVIKALTAVRKTR